ncbi:hypothetical protein ACFL2Q_19965, partial [Thermodesulfobacteriota bacterium]
MNWARLAAKAIFILGIPIFLLGAYLPGTSSAGLNDGAWHKIKAGWHYRYANQVTYYRKPNIMDFRYHHKLKLWFQKGR